MELKEPASSYQKKFYTIREYLEMETLEKHEHYKSEIFAMAGAGNIHNIILAAVGVAAKRLQGVITCHWSVGIKSNK